MLIHTNTYHAHTYTHIYIQTVLGQRVNKLERRLHVMAAQTRLCVQVVFQRDQTQVQRASLLPVVSQARPMYKGLESCL